MKPEELEVKAAAELAKQQAMEVRLVCCSSTGCQSSGAADIVARIKADIAARGLDGKVQVGGTGCMGLCSKGPLVRMTCNAHEDVLFSEMTPDLATRLVEEVVAPIASGETVDNPVGPLSAHVVDLHAAFFAMQERVVLSNNGHADPEKLADYLVHGGYQGLRKALTMSAEEICKEMLASGLRGRGGAGYPTGLKWDFARRVESDVKYVICNGDEGDPGAFMDRSVLEGDPHAVIEGMMIAARAMNATNGVFYIRAEYPLAVDRIEKAIRQARQAGLVGRNILNSGWSFDFDVRLGAGAFVCGEETALIASVEGKRGTPRPRPPFPSVKGLWDKPSCVNNVETLANVPRILLKGADWFAAKGTEKSKGTKVFALTGKIAHNGLVEVPMGITIREIVETIGGGTGTDRKVKGVQTGGPSGGMIPESQFDTPISYEHLQQLGSMMGSGGLIVIDDQDSVVELARFYLDFCVDESCGKCAPCRIGGTQMLHLLDKIVAGDGTEEDIVNIRMIAQAMQRGSLCALGQTAPNPVLSALKHFTSEFTERLKKPVAAEA
ncbi:NADH-ubiquinone oxidoreductase-F iron-sulfur binding region domain-containing protein [Pleomorphomonas sp. PLEO]|uniref:NADH-ubiquinone oxidoreductase-F iron-sulfur binding region domain-containing protein n=1 Tax=Pleomorphomonas sp. PLEO TaxID=3239306 RepID=UPI00351E5C0F